MCLVFVVSGPSVAKCPNFGVYGSWYISEIREHDKLRWMGLMGHRSLKRTVLFGDAPLGCLHSIPSRSLVVLVLFPSSCYLPHLLRPWLHCFSLQSHITKADRQKHSWNSSGNTKVKKVHGKVVCVCTLPHKALQYIVNLCHRSI